MGQKINPISLRLGIQKNWTSRWFAKKDFSKNLIEDIQIRQLIQKNLGGRGGVDKIIIERDQKQITLNIHTSKPGVIIGRQGKGIDALAELLKQKLGHPVKINIIEVRKSDLSAQIVAENISIQITKRMPYRRVVKQALERTMQSGALGIKVQVSGRLNGGEIARSEKFSDGSIPSTTLDAKIDYALVHAMTTYGIIGVKVWIYIGKYEIEDED